MDMQQASSSKREMDENKEGSGKKVKFDPLTYKDRFVYTLDTDDSENKVKITVSVGTDSNGEIKSILSHLRRYNKEGFATRQGVSLRVEDLKTIFSLVDFQDPDFASYTPSRNLSARTTENKIGESIVTIEVSGGRKEQKLIVSIDIWNEFVTTLTTLRYIVKCIGKQDKRVLTEDILLVIHSDEIEELYRTNRFEGSLEKEMIKVRPNVEKQMEIIEKMVDIPHQITSQVIEKEGFISVVNKFSTHKSEAKDLIVKNVRLMLKNEI